MNERPLAINVAIKQRTLQGSFQDDELQRVATVYVDREEYKVTAPPDAVGDALDWVGQFGVQQTDRESFSPGDIEVVGAFRILAIKLTKEKLEEMKRDAHRAVGMNPDNLHYDAQICARGHVQSALGQPFERGEHCKKCGAICLDECPQCKSPIRGHLASSSVSHYTRPSFCYKCGRPFPWMEDALSTARELLWHDDKLSLEEREKLWNLLQYVMSDPKADLVPAKKKLIEIKLEKAGKVARDVITDLIAKYAAEMSKG
jgi:hypothetical protein